MAGVSTVRVEAAAKPTPCPVCEEGELEVFLELPEVPLLSTCFHVGKPEAVAAPRGDLRLALCRSCALVWNVAFEPERVDYTPDYENSQHFSPAFQRYATQLADRLAATHELEGRLVIEIGSGKGEFLELLCERGSCEGLGFDPTFEGQVDGNGRFRVIRDYFDDRSARGLDVALVLARHVLEHLADPVGFLQNVRRATGHETPVYYEVPNADHVFAGEAMWDLIYQHVAYFGAPTLETALRRAGYEVTDLRTSFENQFLGISAIPSAKAGWTHADASAVDSACGRVDDFASRLNARLTYWRDRLAADRSGEIVLWGAGAKGVAFLNLLGTGVNVDRVIDVNPRKADRFVPGTGHRVEMPTSLAGQDVESVLVLNPAYQQEIKELLGELRSSAVVETV